MSEKSIRNPYVGKNQIHEGSVSIKMYAYRGNAGAFTLNDFFVNPVDATDTAVELDSLPKGAEVCTYKSAWDPLL